MYVPLIRKALENEGCPILTTCSSRASGDSCGATGTSRTSGELANGDVSVKQHEVFIGVFVYHYRHLEFERCFKEGF